GVSTASSFTLDILSGLTQVLPGAQPPAQGTVLVTLLPSGILSGWRFVGELAWRTSGVVAGGLETGDRQIEYRPVPGYIQPLPETVSVVSGGAQVNVTARYYQTSGGAVGGMTVYLKPDGLMGAQWRLVGEDDTMWRNSGDTIGTVVNGVLTSGLLPGTYQ